MKDLTIRINQMISFTETYELVNLMTNTDSFERNQVCLFISTTHFLY